MKKRAAKAKPAAKKSAAKSSVKTKTKTKPAAKAAKTAAAGPKPTPYTPAPIKGDGWPPFRYPLQ